jgi:peroxiredoxin Q/BCP
MQKLVFILLIAVLSCNGSAQKHLIVGDPIPLFILKDQDGKDFDVKNYIGKKILVIYFYPKDESVVCTKESCSFRDSFADFEKAGASVVGINDGSIESHQSFQQNHQLPFILLSDPGNKVYRLFGVKKKFIFSGRETFVVDKAGKIAFSFDSFTNGPEHSRKALQFIRQMKE